MFTRDTRLLVPAALRGAGLACFLACFSACGTGEAEPLDDTQALEDPSGLGPLDALARRFGRLKARLRDRGYTQEVGVDRFFVSEEAAAVVPMDLPTGSCTTLVALAAGTVHDLSLSIFDSYGRELATDAVLGQGALAHVCPQEIEQEPAGASSSAPPGLSPHYLVLRARDGEGAVVAGAYRSAPGEGDGFEELFDGLLTPEVPFREVEDSLSQSRNTLRDRGLLPVGDPIVGALAEGERLRLSADLTPGHCYVAVSRAGPGVLDTDLLLYSPSNAEVARELGDARESRLEFCPEEPGRYRYEAHAYEGSGAVGLMVFSEPRGASPAAPSEEELSAGIPEVARAASALLSEVSIRLSSRGYQGPTFLSQGGTFLPGEVRVVDAAFGPGCFLVVGAAGSESDLDLYLRGADGEEVDQDTRVAPVAQVRTCPTERTQYHIAVKGYGRRNQYELALFAAPTGISTVRELRLERATALFSEREYEELGRVETTLDRGETFERVATIPAGECRAWAVAGDRDVLDVDLFLRDAEEQLLVSESGSEPFGSVARCAEGEDELVRLRVLMYAGSGSALVVALRGQQGSEGGE